MAESIAGGHTMNLVYESLEFLLAGALTGAWHDNCGCNILRAKADRDIATDPKGARWKIEVAAHLRRKVAAPYRWIAASLNMGSPLAIRVNVCRLANG